MESKLTTDGDFGPARALRVAMVSDTGVARGGVYGMRILRFAHELAALGHQVVLISPVTPGVDAASGPEEVAGLISAHDWREPLVLRARTAGAKKPVSRSRIVRQIATFGTMLRHGGTDLGWQKAARPLAEAVARAFRPEAVWATFGSTSNLMVARHLAGLAGAPWLADMKDNVDIYVHPLVRQPMKAKLKDVAALTSNAELHAEAAERWLGKPASVLYSGIAADMEAGADSRPEMGRFLITLIGSVYDTGRVERFVAGLNGWLAGRSEAERGRIHFRYAGVDAAKVSVALEAAAVDCASEISGNVPHADLARLCHAAAVNCYIWEPRTFHHKLLELLACRRPVIAFPGENAEAMPMAGKAGGMLLSSPDGAALGAALDQAFALWSGGYASVPAFDGEAFSWRNSARGLEAVLRAAAAGKHG